MEILVGGVIVLAGAVYWCAGGWAARVVATILLVPFGAFCVGGAISSLTAPNHLAPQTVAGIIIGGVAGWLLAAWPRWYWERRAKREDDAAYALTARHWAADNAADSDSASRVHVARS